MFLLFMQLFDSLFILTPRLLIIILIFLKFGNNSFQLNQSPIIKLQIVENEAPTTQQQSFSLIANFIYYIKLAYTQQFCKSREARMHLVSKILSRAQTQLKNLNITIKLQLQKAGELLKKSSQSKLHNKSIFSNLEKKMNQVKEYTQYFDQFLKIQRTEIKDKIMLDLQFDDIKEEVDPVLQDLKNAIADARKAIVEDQEPSYIAEVEQNSSEDDPKMKNTDGMDSMVSMDSTINYQKIISRQQINLEFAIILHSNNKVVQEIKEKSPDLATIKQKINFSEIINEKILYTVAGANYKSVYPTIKALTKEIDEISTEGHFHFILNKIEQVQTSEDQSFSDEIDPYNSFKVFARKVDSQKALYIYREEKWQKIEQQQIQIVYGDRVAAYKSDKSQEPQIYYSIQYNLTNM